MALKKRTALLAAAALATTMAAPLPATAAQRAVPDDISDTARTGAIEGLPVAGLSEEANRQLLQRAKDSIREGRLEAAGDRDGGRRPPTVDLPDANPGVAPARDYTADPLVGTTRTWLALDNAEGVLYGKDYRLAAVGDHIEVWVAVGDNASFDPATGIYTLPFPEGDCRNTTYEGLRVQVTPDQLNQLVADFDRNIHPLETAYFRTPPPRNGEQALLTELAGVPPGYFATEGGADRTVTLIDNVRDANYYTPPNVEVTTYIAGFFSPTFNEFFDRNTMTVDAWDWLHRTGANPPDDGNPDPCLNAPANAFLYEGVFAHEWQHLLQSYTGEVTWLNEGLSDWAQTLTGYVDPSLPITDPRFDSHIQCFYGYLAERHPTNLIPLQDAGPENSLTWWEDQGPGEILCDYGAAYTMLEYLVGQFGVEAATFLHNDPATGLDSVSALLAEVGDPRSAIDVVHDWAAMIALDAALDRNRYRLAGHDADRVQTPTLHASVRWEGDDAYASPGAPPNGSDYVRLRQADGDWLDWRRADRLTFATAARYTPVPVEWTVDDPGGDELDDEALYSGSGDALDRSMAFAVTVPAADPTLTFETRYDIEFGWDFGFVQVSTDGGETWTSLADELTTEEHADNPEFPQIAANLPGLTGTSVLTEEGEATFTPEEPATAPDWIPASFDLSAYAGQEVLIGFRYMTDGSYARPGWWVDDIAVGGTLVNDGSTTEGLRSYEEIAPVPIGGWTLQLVGLDDDGRGPVRLQRYEVTPGTTLQLRRGQLLRAFAGMELIAAIVTLDDPTGAVQRYAPYRLEVNGVLQPGGGSGG